MPRHENPGITFEKEMAKTLGLDRVPGSGNQWHSKLDLKGRLTRWSLKFTSKDRYTITQADIDEARAATTSLSGDGRVPLWLLRLATSEYDLVVIGLPELLALADGEQFVVSQRTTGNERRKSAAKLTALERKENGSD
jgi:hypothetical protein